MESVSNIIHFSMVSKVILQLCAILIAIHCCIGIKIEPRSAWKAARPKSTINSIKEPVQYVIIHHTDNKNGCTDSARCQQLLRNIQNSHTSGRGFSDIGYSFIVAGDGKVYEGRGYGKEGAHTKGYNTQGIGIAFLGNFENQLPSPTMLNNAKQLISQAVAEGHVRSDYILLGHRQTKATACPGTKLYNEIKTWPHWKSI